MTQSWIDASRNSVLDFEYMVRILGVPVCFALKFVIYYHLVRFPKLFLVVLYPILPLSLPSKGKYKGKLFVKILPHSRYSPICKNAIWFAHKPDGINIR